MRRLARDGDSVVPGGSLEGELIGVKDLFRVDGLPTTAGSALPPEVFAGPESAVVQALKHAGAVVLGKTTTDEFGYSEPPPTRNPRDLSRTPGGSSSGSAAAVAAGMCRLAIGSQTLQSTITPASYCGVVGFATSHGRVPFDGIGAAPSLDTVGFLGVSVRTIADALAVTVSDWKGTDLTAPTIGVCNPWGARRLHTETWTAFADHAAALRGAGFECKAVTMPWDAERGVDLSRSIGDLLNAEFAELHAEWFDRFGDLYRQLTADAIVRGREVDAYRLAEARSRQRDMVAELEDLTEATGVDCWVCPAGQLAPLDRESTDNWMTRFWAFAGWPAVTLPVFDGPAGLPHGLQIVARHGQDEQLIGWASMIAATVGSQQDGAR